MSDGGDTTDACVGSSSAAVPPLAAAEQQGEINQVTSTSSSSIRPATSYQDDRIIEEEEKTNSNSIEIDATSMDGEGEVADLDSSEWLDEDELEARREKYPGELQHREAWHASGLIAFKQVCEEFGNIDLDTSDDEEAPALPLVPASSSSNFPMQLPPLPPSPISPPASAPTGAITAAPSSSATTSSSSSSSTSAPSASSSKPRNNTAKIDRQLLFHLHQPSPAPPQSESTLPDFTDPDFELGDVLQDVDDEFLSRRPKEYTRADAYELEIPHVSSDGTATSSSSFAATRVQPKFRMPPSVNLLYGPDDFSSSSTVGSSGAAASSSVSIHPLSGTSSFANLHQNHLLANEFSLLMTPYPNAGTKPYRNDPSSSALSLEDELLFLEADELTTLLSPPLSSERRANTRLTAQELLQRKKRFFQDQLHRIEQQIDNLAERKEDNSVSPSPIGVVEPPPLVECFVRCRMIPKPHSPQSQQQHRASSGELDAQVVTSASHELQLHSEDVRIQFHDDEDDGVESKPRDALRINSQLLSATATTEQKEEEKVDSESKTKLTSPLSATTSTSPQMIELANFPAGKNGPSSASHALSADAQDEEEDEFILEWFLEILPAASTHTPNSVASVANSNTSVFRLKPRAPGTHGWFPRTSPMTMHRWRLQNLPPLPPPRSQRSQALAKKHGEQFDRIGPVDRVTRLPNEILIMVASFLSGTSVAACLSRVSSRWNRIASEKRLWNQIVKQSYAKPQPLLHPKHYYQFRLEEDRKRNKAFDMLPTVQSFTHQARQNRLAKTLITPWNSGTAGLLHCICWLVFLILLSLKAGNFFTRAPDDAHLNTKSEYILQDGEDVNREWGWVYIFIPMYISHLMFFFSYLSWLYLSTRSDIDYQYFSVFQFGLMGALLKMFQYLPVLRNIRNTNLRRFPNRISTWASTISIYSFLEQEAKVNVNTFHLNVIYWGIFAPFQLGTILTQLKLSYSDRFCHDSFNGIIPCSDDAHTRYVNTDWVYVMIPYLLPFFFTLLYLVFLQYKIFQERHVQLADRCCRSCAPNLCYRMRWPDRVTLIGSIELMGLITTVLLVSHTVDQMRTDMGQLSKPVYFMSTIPSIASRLYLTAAHWPVMCFLPMWLAHAFSTVYIQVYFFRFFYDQLHWGWTRFARCVRTIMYMVGSAVCNILSRSVFISMEIMIAYTMNQQIQQINLLVDAFPGSSNSAPSDALSFPQSAIPVEPSSLINPTYIALPFIISFSIFILCGYCPNALVDISRRRRVEGGLPDY